MHPENHAKVFLCCEGCMHLISQLQHLSDIAFWLIFGPRLSSQYRSDLLIACTSTTPIVAVAPKRNRTLIVAYRRIEKSCVWFVSTRAFAVGTVVLPRIRATGHSCPLEKDGPGKWLMTPIQSAEPRYFYANSSMKRPPMLSGTSPSTL